MKLLKVLLCSVLTLGCIFGMTGCKGGSSSSGNTDEELSLKTGDLIAEICIEDYGTMKAKLFPKIAPNAVENFQKLAKIGYYDGLKIHRVAKDMCIAGGSLNGDGSGGNALVGENGTFPLETDKDARNFYGALGYVPNAYGENAVQFYVVNCKKKDDITQYSPALIREEANSFAEMKEGLEENDPDEAYYTYQETYYNTLAEMLSKPGDTVIKKYKETTGGYPMWDGACTVFGQVYEGFDVLTKISEAEVVTAGSGKVEKPKTDIIIESVKVYEYTEPEAEEDSE